MISKFFKNPTLTKIFSLIAAILLWLFVGAQNPDAEMVFRGVEIRIEYNNETEDGVTVLELEHETADITLKGSKNVLSRITSTDITAKIEVDARLSPGWHTVPINVTKPVESVTVTDKNPVSVRVYLDRTASTIVPVRAVVEHELDEAQYLVEEPLLSVDSIELRGPETELAAIREAVVMLTITESNMADVGIPLLVNLVNQDSEIADMERIELSMRSIQVTPRVSERVELPVTVDFLNRPEGWLNTDFNYGLSNTSVRLLVPLQDLSEMTSYSAGTVDLALYEQDTDVVLPFQSPYQSEEEQPDITVSLRFGSLQTFRWALQNIRYDNIPEGLSVEVLSTLPIDIGMRGTRGAVAAYSGRGLSGIVDLAGLKAGETATLPVRIVTGDPEIGALGSVSITVRMSDEPAQTGSVVTQPTDATQPADSAADPTAADTDS